MTAAKATTTHRRRPVDERKRRSYRGLIIGSCIAACCIFAAFALYPAARDYYIAAREVSRLQGEYDAVKARNDQIAEQISTLQTSEGIADRAREQFGWVASGETAVNITGLKLSASTTSLPADVPRGLVNENNSWLTAFLDSFFSVPEPKEPAKLDDPFQ